MIRQQIILLMLIGLCAVPWKDALKTFRNPKPEYTVEIFHYHYKGGGNNYCLTIGDFHG
jgi:hypothetical protein